MKYVILAAGQGSRFVREGVATPKPMVEILGVPMIERLIRELMKCDCESISIVTNSSMTSLNGHLRKLRDEEGLPLTVRPIESDNSFYSLSRACEGVEGRFIALSVDTVFSPDEFRGYVDAVGRCSGSEMLMALTRYVDDESPLYARLSADGTQVTGYRYGGRPFDGTPIVSAGIYALTAEAVASAAGARSLSDFQRLLAEGKRFTVRPYELTKAFDVDRTHDLRAAERYLRAEARRAEYRATLKSADTEEHIDLAFYRPIGFAWALLFRRLRVSPNVVTIISIVFGVAAGFFIYPDSIGWNLIGMLLLVIANSLDSADGQLARMTRRYSRLGRILDGIAGDLWFISIYVAIAMRTNATQPCFGMHPALIWVIAVAAGLCHAIQAAMADHLRQFHLFFVKKNFPAELDDSASLKAQCDKLPRNRFFQRAILGVYYVYTRTQERITPSMQRLIGRIRRDYPDGDIPAPLAERIRLSTLPLCKWENFLTFNWRSITLFASVIAGYPYLYFLAELTVFNAVHLYMLITHERICRRLL